MKKNIIVKGDIGTGKTRNYLFPKFREAIKNGESVLTFSTTEEYLSNYYEELKKDAYNVIIVNFNDIKRSMGWNPLSYSYKLYRENNEDEAIVYLESFYKNLFKVARKSENMDDFWEMSARSLAIAVTLALFIKGDEDKINISGVAEMVRDEDLKDHLKVIDDKSLQVYAQSFISAPTETKGGIISVCLQTLRIYESRPHLRLMLANTTYKYENILRKPTAVFIINGEFNRDSLPLVTSFISEICLLAKESDKNFNIILDEFELLLPFLDDDFTYLVRGANKHNYAFTLSVHNDQMLLDTLGHYILTISEMLDIKDAAKKDIKVNSEKVNLEENLIEE